MSVTVKLPSAPKLKPAAPRVKPLAPRPCVLIVAGSNGYLEVYTSPGVRTHVAEHLAVHPGNESAADEYLAATLPPWAAEVYQASDLAATRTLAPRSVEDEAASRLAVALVREAARISKESHRD